MLRVIINADDFGFNTAVNQGVAQSFENGWISSTTIMANMPGFEEACQLAHEQKLIGRVGLHFNLIKGEALSSHIVSQPRFCDRHSQFVFTRYKGMHLSAIEEAAVAEELKAQWGRCLENGIRPTHVDTHGHVHMAWGIAKVIIKVAKQVGIRAVRVHWNVVPARNIVKKVYYKIMNRRYHQAGLMVTPYAAQASQAPLAICKGMTPLEIMVHPELAGDGTIMDHVENRPLKEVFDSFAITGKLASYGELLNANTGHV